MYLKNSAKKNNISASTCTNIDLLITLCKAYRDTNYVEQLEKFTPGKPVVK